MDWADSNLYSSGTAQKEGSRAMRSHHESSGTVTKGRNNGTEMANTNDTVLEVVPSRYERNNVEGNRKSVMFSSVHCATATWWPNELLRWQHQWPNQPKRQAR